MALTTPILTDIIGGNQSLNVTWEQVPGSVESYQIHYGTAPGLYTGIKSVIIAELGDAANPNYILNAENGVSLVNNATYWVSISAIEAVTGTETSTSVELSAITVASSIVRQPQNLRIAASDATLSLTWKIPDTAVDGYTIEYSVVDGEWSGSGATEGDSPIIVAGNISQFTLSGLVNNTTPYRVRISANIGSVNSANTGVVVGVPQTGVLTPVTGSFVKLSKDGGARLVGSPLKPNTTSADAVSIGLFWGASTVSWKPIGATGWTTRILAWEDDTVAISPMESILINTTQPTTKYLSGNGWKTV